MKKLLIPFLIFASFIGLYASDFKVQKDLKVKDTEVINYSVVSFGGTIEVDGKIEGSIILMGGNLVLNGTVDEDVVCFASKVKTGPETIIKGDFIAIGGQLDENTKNIVNGEYFYFKFNLKEIENTLIPILSDTKTITFLRAVKIILWFVIALVVLAVVPKKITLAERIFEPNILKIGAIGIFSVFSALSLLLIFIIKW